MRVGHASLGRLALLLLALFVAGATAACNAILGIDAPIAAPDEEGGAEASAADGGRPSRDGAGASDGASQDGSLPDAGDGAVRDSTLSDGDSGADVTVDVLTDAPADADAARDAMTSDADSTVPADTSSPADSGQDSTVLQGGDSSIEPEAESDASDSGPPPPDASDSGSLPVDVSDGASDGADGSEAAADGGSDASKAFDGNCTCASDACAPIVLEANQPGALYVAADSNGVYWNTGYASEVGGNVFASNLDGTNVRTLDSFFGTADMAAAGGFLYWGAGTESYLSAYPTSGGDAGSVQHLGPGSIAHVAANGAGVAWTTAESGLVLYAPPPVGPLLQITNDMTHGPDHVALDQANVYWADEVGLWSCPLSGCSPSPVSLYTSTTSPAVAGLVTDGTTLYFTDGDFLYSCPVTGCSQPTMLSLLESDMGASSLALDGSTLYVVTRDQGNPTVKGQVLRVALGGTTSAAISLLGQSSFPQELAVGSTCLYWTDSTDNAVYATAK